MSISLYDKAIYDKIHAWLPDPRLRILKVDETAQLFRMAADIKNDAPLTLPLVSILRKSEVSLLQSTKSMLTYNGIILNKEAVEQGQDARYAQLNGIPIEVTYQIDIYTKKYYEGDEMIRELAFQLINNPKLEIEIPYCSVNIVHPAYIRVIGSIVDNSDIAEKRFADQFTRWTIQFKLENAYLFRVKETTPVSMGEDVEVSSGGGSTETVTVLGELDVVTKLEDSSLDVEEEALEIEKETEN